MKYVYVLALVFCLGCGGSLSDEQREKIREGMELQKIVKVSDAEIMAEALEKGQAVHKTLRLASPTAADSIAGLYRVKINFAVPGQKNSRQLEQELIEAYINGIAAGSSQENLQKIWTSPAKDNYDSLLYTFPQLVIHPDGVEELKGIWNVYIAKKDVVLDIGRDQ